jgi:hypothetical protein
MAAYPRPNARNINFLSIQDLNFNKPATIADVKNEIAQPTTTTKTFSSIVNIADGNIVNSLQVSGDTILGDEISDTVLINGSMTLLGNLNNIPASTINGYNTRITNNTNDILTKKDITEYETEKAIIEADILLRKLTSEYNTEKAILDSNVNELVDVNNSQNSSITNLEASVQTINTNITAINNNIDNIEASIITNQNNITNLTTLTNGITTDITNINTTMTNYPDFQTFALTSYVDDSINNIIGGASPAYDTLLEIQNILQTNEGSIDTLLTQIDTKQPILNSSNRLDALNIGTGVVNNTKFNYLSNLQSDLQTSLNSKLEASNNITFTGTNTFDNNLTSTNIIEKNTNISVSAGVGTCNYLSGAVFYVSGQTANFRVDIANIPNATNRTFTISLIINTASNKFYANTLRVNSTTRTILFLGGASAINISTATNVLQQITIVYDNSSATVPILCFSSVSPILA